MGITFIGVSPTGSVLSTQPLTYDEEPHDNLLETQTYDDADLLAHINPSSNTHATASPITSTVIKQW
jgi:hypothetical protein